MGEFLQNNWFLDRHFRVLHLDAFFGHGLWWPWWTWRWGQEEARRRWRRSPALSVAQTRVPPDRFVGDEVLGD